MKAVIIGMGPGIGLSLAKRYGRAGFEVLMIARDAEKLGQFQQELSSQGIRASSLAVDIADETAYQAALERLAADHPDVEILHYNASSYNPGTPSQIPLPIVHTDFKINVVGALLAAQEFFPQMRERGRGAIFFTGGGTAFNPGPTLASLGIGKAGIRNLTFSLADECLPFGIHVATVTVCGMVKAGTRFDPDLIADAFWQLYEQPRAEWQLEVVME